MPEYAITNAGAIAATGHDGRPTLREEWSWPASDAGPPLVAQVVLPPEPRATVILVHGLAQNRHTWAIGERSLPHYLASRGLASVNLELRGHGRSREAGSGNARHFSEYVDDVVRVAQSLSAPPFVLGHSLGAAAGVGAATRTPLAGLVHVAGVYRFASANPVLRGIARASMLAAPWLTQASVRVSTAWAGRLIGTLYGLTDIAGHGLPLAGWVPGSMERPLLEARLRDGFDWTSLEVWLELASWANGVQFPYAEAFRATDIPLLVLAGDADPLARPVDARACYDDAASADKQFIELEPFEYGAHWGHIDILLGRRAPRIVWPLIGDWLVERS